MRSEDSFAGRAVRDAASLSPPSSIEVDYIPQQVDTPPPAPEDPGATQGEGVKKHLLQLNDIDTSDPRWVLTELFQKPSEAKVSKKLHHYKHHNKQRRKHRQHTGSRYHGGQYYSGQPPRQQQQYPPLISSDDEVLERHSLKHTGAPAHHRHDSLHHRTTLHDSKDYHQHRRHRQYSRHDDPEDDGSFDEQLYDHESREDQDEVKFTVGNGDYYSGGNTINALTEEDFKNIPGGEPRQYWGPTGGSGHAGQDPKGVGPRFDRSLPRNVTVQAGKSAVLACRVLDVSKTSQVSWMRHGDLHILSVGKYRYSTDSRISIKHNSEQHEWLLRIQDVQEQDAGRYECQVSSKPVLSFIVNMEVVANHAAPDEAPTSKQGQDFIKLLTRQERLCVPASREGRGLLERSFCMS
ncbi:dpr6, isoform D [Penaeus vannamei]|uniref:Dpr6, isoform D n=1 Tax=Penaeus vannamei TaxID=6689 RepID=A0A423U845_PENVA|nr:dpr6, isoform D [Penaeus vannamei]